MAAGPRRFRLRVPARPGWLIPLSVYCLLATLYLFAIPPGESPDEGGHVQCIEQVSRDSRLPVVEPPPQGVVWARSFALSGVVCYHMPLYYLLNGYLQRGVHLITGAPLHYEFPPTNPAGPSPNMFVHAPRASFWTLAEPATLIASRIVSIALWGGFLLATYGTARRVYPARPAVAAAAATWLAGWPQFLFLSRAINNDALALPLTALVLWALLDVGRPRRFVWAALLTALAILTKLTTAFLVVVLGVVWGIEVVWARPQSKGSICYLKAAGLSGLILAAAAGLIAAHPILRAHAAGTQAETRFISEQVYALAYWLDVGRVTLTSGWVGFGIMNVFAPAWQAYSWWSLVGVLSLVALGVSLRQAAQNGRQRMQFVILAVWALGVLGVYVRINMNRFQPQFRYIFALLPLLAVSAGVGWVWLGRGWHRAGRAAALIWPLALALILINAWIIVAVVFPAYGT